MASSHQAMGTGTGFLTAARACNPRENTAHKPGGPCSHFLGWITSKFRFFLESLRAPLASVTGASIFRGGATAEDGSDSGLAPWLQPAAETLRQRPALRCR